VRAVSLEGNCYFSLLAARRSKSSPTRQAFFFARLGLAQLQCVGVQNEGRKGGFQKGSVYERPTVAILPPSSCSPLLLGDESVPFLDWEIDSVLSSFGIFLSQNADDLPPPKIISHFPLYD